MRFAWQDQWGHLTCPQDFENLFIILKKVIESTCVLMSVEQSKIIFDKIFGQGDMVTLEKLLLFFSTPLALPASYPQCYIQWVYKAALSFTLMINFAIFCFVIFIQALPWWSDIEIPYGVLQGRSKHVILQSTPVKPPVDLYLIFEKSSCKNQFRNWFLQATQAVKIQFDID